MALFKRILVPHDFSSHATAALKVAAQLATQHGGRLTVLHVITPFHPSTGSAEEALAWAPDGDLVAGERHHLEGLVSRVVRGRRAPRVTCKVEIGDAFHRIIDAARHVDSIVMASAGRTGLPLLLIGSTAEKVVRHSPVPVLTLRARMARPTVRRGRTARRR